MYKHNRRQSHLKVKPNIRARGTMIQQGDETSLAWSVARLIICGGIHWFKMAANLFLERCITFIMWFGSLFVLWKRQEIIITGFRWLLTCWWELWEICLNWMTSSYWGIGIGSLMIPHDQSSVRTLGWYSIEPSTP